MKLVFASFGDGIVMYFFAMDVHFQIVLFLISSEFSRKWNLLWKCDIENSLAYSKYADVIFSYEKVSYAISYK